MAALDFPASPGFGQSHVQNGSAWQWDNEKWKVNVLGTYLPLLGGTMLGPITLANDAVNPLEPVTLRQGTSLYVPLVGGGIVTGPTTIMGAQFTAKKNLMINMPEPVNMSTATTTDGGSIRAWYMTANNYMFSTYWDGASFRRLNATDTPSQLSAGGGTLVYQTAGTTGAANTTVTLNQVFSVSPTGAGYFANNLGVWQGNLAGTHVGLVSAQNVIVNNAYGVNTYHDGTNWRYRAAGSAALIHQDTSAVPALNFYNSPISTAGAVATLTFSLQIEPTGIRVPGRIYINATNGWEHQLYHDVNGHHIHNHRANWYELWNTGNGTWTWNSPNGQCMAIDGSGTFTANGYLYSPGSGRVDGSWSSGSTFTALNGRIISKAGPQAALAMYCTNSGYAFGMYVDATTLNFCQSDANGTAYKYLGQVNVNGDLNMIGALTGTYLHSTGDIVADGGVISKTGRVQAQNTGEPSIFMHRPGYFAAGMLLNASNQVIIANMGGGGNWQASWLTISDSSVYAPYDISCGRNMSTGGMFCSTLVASGNSYSGGGMFVGGNGDTQFGWFYGGAGKVMQMQGGWYWSFNTGNGDMGWVKGNESMFWMYAGYEGSFNHYRPCYNWQGAFVSFGSYTFSLPPSKLRSSTRSARGLAEIMQIDAIKYRRGKVAASRSIEPFAPEHDPPEELGFSAEAVAALIPEAATVGTEGGTINHLGMIAVLWTAVKELGARVMILEGSTT